MKGNHVTRHNPRLWNGIWSDMFIESTFIRYGHESSGLVGLILQLSAVSRWVLSFHVCGHLRGDIALKDGQIKKNSIAMHQKEAKFRILSDVMDRAKLKTTKLQVEVSNQHTNLPDH